VLVTRTSVRRRAGVAIVASRNGDLSRLFGVFEKDSAALRQKDEIV
jgi:hypothetical protein